VVDIVLVLCPSPCGAIGVTVAVSIGVTVIVLALLLGVAIPTRPSSPSTYPKRSVVSRSSIVEPSKVLVGVD
jgi:hypothetical protein